MTDSTDLILSHSLRRFQTVIKSLIFTEPLDKLVELVINGTRPDTAFGHRDPEILNQLFIWKLFNPFSI